MIERIAIIGLGLLGGSVGLAVRSHAQRCVTAGFDHDPDVRKAAAERGLADTVCETIEEAVAGADCVFFCVPVGAIESAGRAAAPHLGAHAIVSDVGSSKEGVAATLARIFPNNPVVPAHPVAGTEQSGPQAGFDSLFQHRWCILTPDEGTDQKAIDDLSNLWEALGAKVEIMDARHHDLVLAVTSHIPHLIAFTIVGTASDMEEVTRGEVIKYSAGGFRDFTRIAASDPVMWRDVFLHNRDAVLEMLDRFTGDLASMQDAIRSGDGDALLELFRRTRAIRRSIIEQGQDDARPDFGRGDHGEDEEAS